MAGLFAAYAGLAVHMINRLWQAGYEAGHAAGLEEAAAAQYIFGCANPGSINQLSFNVGSAVACTGMSYPWDQPY